MPDVTLYFDTQARLRPLLEERLQTLPPTVRADVEKTLVEKGSLLAAPSSPSYEQEPPPAGVWALLTWLVAQALAPDVDPRVAGRVAVAGECLHFALDALDNVMDDDHTPLLRELGPSRLRKVAMELLSLAQQGVLDLSHQGVDAGRVVVLLKTMQEATLAASAGQHRDLLAEARAAADLTPEECLEIAAAKAGALFRLACRLGAECAGAESPVVEYFSELGLLLGIAAQLDNDCRDLEALLQAIPGDRVPLGEALQEGVRSDLRRGKKTLPVVLAARALPTSQGIATSLPKPLLQEKILAARGIAQVYYERVREALQGFERERGRLAPALRALLLPMEV